ncbi:methylphosphotriester-DNA--protein-cysteine methyltransferase family protein [bacterium BFN5]|nr:methylphosphotriester-DNA--protein-cysteine methyltransferase family protein [bacterium BFN5]QJW47166.1 methylphosphotriester-DNA--protein-cysteine methyltransferase family protein [bacterium BFN5]
MKPSVAIPEYIKWQAVVSCNKDYDGLFLYGVTTTGIFCHPSCRAKTPMRKNVVYFMTPEAALNAGFRPCKKCRPELLTFEPDQDVIKKAILILNQTYHQPIHMTAVARQVGVSLSHFNRLFKKVTNFTPTQYLAKRRVTEAIRLLKQTEHNILEIAYSTGFRSLSSFYQCFKTYCSHTPNQIRRQSIKANKLN